MRLGFLRRWVICRILISFNNKRLSNYRESINKIGCNKGQDLSRYQILRRCISEICTNYKLENRWIEHVHNLNHLNLHKLKSQIWEILLKTIHMISFCSKKIMRNKLKIKRNFQIKIYHQFLMQKQQQNLMLMYSWESNKNKIKENRFNKNNRWKSENNKIRKNTKIY